jgi:hypothetical protein
VEENENDSSTAAPAARAGLADWDDWNAGADEDVYADDKYGHDRNGRRRRPPAKRQRHTDHTGNDDFYSESQSAVTAAARSSVAVSDESDAAGDDKGRYRKQRSPAMGSLGAYVRYKHGAADDGYLYGDVLDRQVAAATGVVTSNKKGGKKVRPASTLPAVPPAYKRHRCVAGVNQWITEDGLTVWPKVRGAGYMQILNTLQRAGGCGTQ